MKSTSRREFLGGIGLSWCGAAVGFAIAQRLGFAEPLTRCASERLRFGALDPLVDLIQATPADELMPILVAKLRAGASLSDLVAACALANARAYGGTNYNGYHALMALMPSFEMTREMPAPYTALPVLKVLHRNARFFQATGSANKDSLEPLESPGTASTPAPQGDLVGSIRARDLSKAERDLAALEGRYPQRSYAEIQRVVRDDVNVHRVVLAWRAYDLLRLTGEEHSLTMLRQSVRFCIDEDGRRAGRGQGSTEIEELLPKLIEKHHLDARVRGERIADDAWIEKLGDTIFSSDRAAAAEAVAAALEEGFDPDDVGAAMSLAATRLLLNDGGLTQADTGKPVGSVHGASIGLHASDAANAWRHLARTGDVQNACANLIVGAYHTAGQSKQVGALPHDHDGDPCTKTDPAELRAEIEARIRARDQKGACVAARRYCKLGHSAGELFALLVGFAVSQDGALHAEKYFRTAQEEHAAARPKHQALYLAALTRVSASEFGFPAPGYEEIRKLLAS
jgi:hypothetical protein